MDKWTKKAQEVIRKIRNHPSFVLGKPQSIGNVEYYTDNTCVDYYQLKMDGISLTVYLYKYLEIKIDEDSSYNIANLPLTSWFYQIEKIIAV